MDEEAPTQPAYPDIHNALASTASSGTPGILLSASKGDECASGCCCSQWWSADWWWIVSQFVVGWTKRVSVQTFQCNLQTFNEEDSGLEFDGTEGLDLKFNLFPKLSVRAKFPLPTKLWRKQAVFNVNIEYSCVKYVLLSIIHHEDVVHHRHTVSKYEQWLDDLELGDVDPPNVCIKRDVPKTEKLNNLKINIHVYEKEQHQSSCYNDHRVLADRTINLMLVVGSEGKRLWHSIPLSSVLPHKVSKQHSSRASAASALLRPEVLEKRFQWCSRCRLQIEQPLKALKFSNSSFHKEVSPLKVVYEDIESYIQEETHYLAATESYQVWHPHKTREQSATIIESWSREDNIIYCHRYLDTRVQAQHKMIRQDVILSPQDQSTFDKTTLCPRCHMALNTAEHKKVSDHCYITGKFRSALCHKCKSKLYLIRRTLPVILVNFKCYNTHQIIKYGIGKFKHWKLNVIPKTKENFMSLTVNIPVGTAKDGRPIHFNVIFLDFYEFMHSSLVSFAYNLDSLPFVEVRKLDYPNVTNDTTQRKSVFLYSCLDSLAKLQDSSLPSRKGYRNDLTGESYSEEDNWLPQTAFPGVWLSKLWGLPYGISEAWRLTLCVRLSEIPSENLGAWSCSFYHALDSCQLLKWPGKR